VARRLYRSERLGLYRSLELLDLCRSLELPDLCRALELVVASPLE
jgi:hypothetical protein